MLCKSIQTNICREYYILQLALPYCPKANNSRCNTKYLSFINYFFHMFQFILPELSIVPSLLHYKFRISLFFIVLPGLAWVQKRCCDTVSSHGAEPARQGSSQVDDCYRPKAFFYNNVYILLHGPPPGMLSLPRLMIP